ncbi:hypothetical protein FQA39_LY02967 [Lamprigera yunnana]|nr:hypothetical protein FQA39_LY02967 [Lamprigera yunnana]
MDVQEVCLGPITLGTSLCWTSPVLPQLLQTNSTNTSSFYLTVEESSWVGSMLAIGVLSSAILSGYLAERLGVKLVTLILIIPVLLFCVLVVCTENVYWLCLGRFLSGVSTGGISVVGPMHISEISDVSFRGILGSAFEFLIYFGVLFVSVCGANTDYKTLTVILGSVAIVLGLVFVFIPESPVFLMKSNKRDKAKKSLEFFRGYKCIIDNDLEELQQSLLNKPPIKINKKSLTSKAFFRGLIACGGITIFQQLSGIDGVAFYTVQIFQTADTDINEYLSTIIINSVQLISAVLVIFFIERAGRKFFLYVSASGTCVCLALLATYFVFKKNDIIFPGMNAVPLIVLIIYAWTFALGLGPVPWMINGELFSLEVKGVANGIVITLNWIFLFIVTKTLPVMMYNVGAHYTFYFYSLFCLGPVYLGASISWTSPVLPQLQSNATEASFQLSNNEGSWVGSMLGFGVLIAAIPTGYFASRFGIKRCVIALVIPLLVFTVVTIVSNDVYTLCVARLFSGIATGGICVMSPMYISEISDVRFRGTLGSFFEFLIYVGVVIVAVCGAFVNYITLTVMIGILGLVLAIVFVFLPESPTYLMKVNNKEQAEKALKFYTGKNYDVSNAIDEIHFSIQNKLENQIDIVTALRTKAVMKGLLASMGLTIFQKFGGIECILFYTVNIFQITESGMDAYTSTIILALVQLTSAVLVVFIIEHANRRLFLTISAIGMGLSLLILGAYFHLKEIGLAFSGLGVVPLGSLIVYAFTFSLGLGPILWMINGELFAPNVKGLANGITMTTNWIFLSVVTKSFPIMMTNIGPHNTFYFFACCMFSCVIFIKFCVPETRGKTLEQIQIELNA